MRLDRLCEGISLRSVPPVTVRGVTHDSREVAPGFVFVAVPGFRYDGIHFVEEAVRRGAVAVVAPAAVCEAGTHGVPCLPVADPREALAVLASRFYGHPSGALYVIGVTGTTGKTTVTMLIDHILSHRFRSGLIGSLVTRWGGREVPARFTTPEAPMIQRTMREMADDGVTHVTMEVSSHGIALRRVAAIRFSIVAVTNVQEEHLDFHGDFASYLATKERLVTDAPDARVVLNADNPHSARMQRLAPGRAVLVGVENGIVAAEAVTATRSGSAFRLRVHPGLTDLEGRAIPPEAQEVTCSLLGQHNVQNAVLSAAVALCCGVPLSTVVEALGTFRAPRRRLEIIQEHPFVIVDDTTGVPESFDAVFTALKPLERRRTLVVYALRGGRGPDINRRNAEALARWAAAFPLDLVITTSSRSHADAANRVTPAEERAFLDAALAAGLRFLHVPELDEAIRAGLGKAAPGDLFLLLGAQGMNEGAGIVQRELARRQAPAGIR